MGAFSAGFEPVFGDCIWGGVASLACLASGDASGDSDGNDSRVLGVAAEANDWVLELVRMVPDLREAVDSCEDERSSLSLLDFELAIIGAALQGAFESVQDRNISGDGSDHR